MGSQQEEGNPKQNTVGSKTLRDRDPCSGSWKSWGVSGQSTGVEKATQKKLQEFPKGHLPEALYKQQRWTVIFVRRATDKVRFTAGRAHYLETVAKLQCREPVGLLSRQAEIGVGGGAQAG